MPKSQLNAHRLGQVISVFVCLVWLCTLFSKQGHPVSCPGAWATSELYRMENGVSALKEGGLLLLGGGGRHSSSQTSGAKSRPPFSSALGGVVTAPRVREYIQATTCLTAGPLSCAASPWLKASAPHSAEQEDQWVRLPLVRGWLPTEAAGPQREGSVPSCLLHKTADDWNSPGKGRRPLHSARVCRG